MQIFRFLKTIQRIIIIIIICGFIPLSIYVFSSHQLTINPQTLSTYQLLYQQLNSGFIIDLKNVNKHCTIEQASITKNSNMYCFQYCTIGFTCEVIDSSNSCVIGLSRFVVGGVRYCATKQIKNQLVNNINNTNNNTLLSQIIQLQSNTSLPPLYKLQLISSQTTTIIKPIYYLFNGQLSCKVIINNIGHTLKTQIIRSQGYIMTLRYLFFTLIPIYAITLLSTIIQVCTRYQCKRLMQVSLINASIMSIAIIVIGIVYDIKCSQLSNDIKYIGNNCFIQIKQSEKYKSDLLIEISNGLGNGFSIFMGIIGVLVMLLIMVLGVVGLIQIKMNKLKKEDYSSGYQLYTV